MTSLNRTVRRRPPVTVVRVRRIKRRIAAPTGPAPRRPETQDLSSLILYGQA